MSIARVQKYRYYCFTESNFVYKWDQSLPSTCPNNPNHLIDAPSMTVLDSKTSNVFDAIGFSNAIASNASIPTNTYAMGALGDIKVSGDNLVVQLDFRYGINTDSNDVYFVIASSNGASVTSNASMAILNSGSNTNSAVSLTSSNYILTSCEGGDVMFDAVFSIGRNGNTRYIGCANPANGLMFGYSNTTFGVLRRTNGADIFTPQSQWNVNTMNSVLDPTKGNLYRIQYESAGFGNTAFYVANGTDSSFSLVHEIRYANSNTVPDIIDTNFELYLENRNTTNTTNATIATSCMRAFVEGRRRQLMPRCVFSAFNQKTIVAIAGRTVHTFTIRNKTTYNGFPNNVTIVLKKFSMATTGVYLHYYLFRDAATGVGAPSWNDVDPNSVVEYNTIGGLVQTDTTSPMLASFACYSTRNVDLSQLNIRVAPGQTIVVGCKFFGGTAPDTIASLIWSEER